MIGVCSLWTENIQFEVQGGVCASKQIHLGCQNVFHEIFLYVNYMSAALKSIPWFLIPNAATRILAIHCYPFGGKVPLLTESSKQNLISTHTLAPQPTDIRVANIQRYECELTDVLFVRKWRYFAVRRSRMPAPSSQPSSPMSSSQQFHLNDL